MGNIYWEIEGNDKPRRKDLLELAYQKRTYQQITVTHQYHKGRSGAETYLIYVDGSREIAKFDHPYRLLRDRHGHELIRRLPLKHRASLMEQHIPESFARDEEGVVIYSFQGAKKEKDVNSLGDYFRKNGSEKTTEIIQKIVDECLHDAWKNAPPPVRRSYAVDYDRLLPAHFEVEPSQLSPKRTILTSGEISQATIQEVRPGDAIELAAFELVQIDGHRMKLVGQVPENRVDADIRITLDTQIQSDLLNRVLGSSIDRIHVNVTKTRLQLLYSYAQQANPSFVSTNYPWKLDALTFPDPIPTVERILQYREPEMRLSLIHGDLNLNNIIVDEGGTPFIIDFADCREDGPTLLDLQRLEAHTVLEALAPTMVDADLSAGKFSDIVEFLHEEHSPEFLPRELSSLTEPYRVLYQIRQITKRYRSAVESWDMYYCGLFLVFAGALKYPYAAYEKQLLLIGMAKLKTLMSDELQMNLVEDKGAGEPMQKVKKATYSRILIPIVTALAVLFVFIFGVMASDTVRPVYQGVVGGKVTPTTPADEPKPTSSPTIPPPTITPAPTLALWEHVPPVDGTTLANIIRTGYLKCGIAGNLAGLSYATNRNTDVSWLHSEDRAAGFYSGAKGFDVDICRAIQIAIFGTTDEKKVDQVAYLDLSTGKRFDAVKDSTVHIVSRNSTDTQTRREQVRFLQTTFMDGAKLMLSADTELSPAAVEGGQFDTVLQVIDYLRRTERKICVATGTTTLDVLRLYFDDSQLVTDTRIAEIGVLDTNDKAVTAYLNGKPCEALAGDESQLRSQKKDKPGQLASALIVPQKEAFSIEPLSPFVARGDTVWEDIGNRVIWALIYGEHLGITRSVARDIRTGRPDEKESYILDLAEKSGVPPAEYRIFLGVENPNECVSPLYCFPYEGQEWGLKNNFALFVISQLGNYGEIFERHLGTGDGALGIGRGPNGYGHPFDTTNNRIFFVPPLGAP